MEGAYENAMLAAQHQMALAQAQGQLRQVASESEILSTFDPLASQSHSPQLTR